MEKGEKIVVPEELVDALGQSQDDSNALLVVSKKKKRKSDVSHRSPKLQKKLSRKQRVRLKRQEEKQQKLKEREKLFASLQQHALPAAQTQLFHSTKTLGQRESKKQKLKRAFLEHKSLGFSLTKDAQLEKERPPPQEPFPL